MDWNSIFISLLAFAIFAIGMGMSIWIYYVSIFHPTQWLTPVNKAILITGCDSGIGLQLAKHFHAKGSLVIATVLSQNSKGALQLRNEFQDPSIHLVELDVTSKDSIEQSKLTIEQILADHRTGLHALINNAGVCMLGEFNFYTEQQIDHQIAVNLSGTIHFTRQLLPLLIRQKGRIVNVSSVNAMQSFPGLSVYSATKKAIEGFCDALRMELHRFGVKVVIVRLGDFARLTNIMEKHTDVAAEQKQQLDPFRRQLYGDYFDQYHRSVMSNYGLFSPVSYEASSLYSTFEEAVLAVNPQQYLLTATPTYSLIIYILLWLPLSMREWLLRKFIISKVDQSK